MAQYFYNTKTQFLAQKAHLYLIYNPISRIVSKVKLQNKDSY